MYKSLLYGRLVFCKRHFLQKLDLDKYLQKFSLSQIYILAKNALRDDSQILKILSKQDYIEKLKYCWISFKYRQFV